MSEPFIAEIRIFPYNFAPRGWELCNGQLLSISQNTALFSLLGTTYGGDGKTTFALPDLQGCAPMHPGQGVNLTERMLGEQGGQEGITLINSEMPAHAHPFVAAASAGETTSPEYAYLGQGTPLYAAAQNHVPMSPMALQPAGSSIPHNNLQPYLTFSFCIATQGIFPSRW